MRRDPIPGSELDRIDQPELIFGLAGPVGVDLVEVQAELTSELAGVGYTVQIIKVTSEMRDYFGLAEAANKTFLSTIWSKIEAADRICRDSDDKATLARIAVNAIRRRRTLITGKEEVSADGVAFIVNQLKRPEEVWLLRKVYGRLFFLISAYGSRERRNEFIVRRIKRDISAIRPDEDIESDALKLLRADENEGADPYGQNLEETFPLGDVFINGLAKNEIHEQIHRFIHALFGRNNMAPSKEEFGMYAAKAASLRSSDLSRQVGAAIFNITGELVAQGCNEVPRAFGGIYLAEEQPDNRDVMLGYDPNEQTKRRILRDLFKRLWDINFLSNDAVDIGSPEAIVEHLMAKAENSQERRTKGGLIGAEILDLSEYGRVVHAEMCAICEAARLGDFRGKGNRLLYYIPLS